MSVAVVAKVVCMVVVHLNRNQIQNCCSTVEKPSDLGHEVLVPWKVHEEVR